MHPKLMYKDISVGKFVLYTYLFSWIVWIIGFFVIGFDFSDDGYAQFAPYFVVGSFGPSLVGLTMMYMRSKFLFEHGVGSLLSWKLKPSSIVYLYVLSLVMVTVIFVVSVAHQDQIDLTALASLFVAIPINAILAGFLEIGPLGEELGWRGLLLNSLDQHSNNYWYNDILVAIVWALWHFPLAFFEVWRIVSWPLWLVLYPISILFFTKILNTLYRTYKRSVLYAIVLHGGINYLLFQLRNLVDFDTGYLLYAGALVFFVVSLFVVMEINQHQLQKRYLSNEVES